MASTPNCALCGKCGIVHSKKYTCDSRHCEGGVHALSSASCGRNFSILCSDCFRVCESNRYKPSEEWRLFHAYAYANITDGIEYSRGIVASGVIRLFDWDDEIIEYDGFTNTLQQFRLSRGESVCVGKHKIPGTVANKFKTKKDGTSDYSVTVTVDGKTLLLSGDDIDFAWGSQVTVGFFPWKMWGNNQYQTMCDLCGVQMDRIRTDPVAMMPGYDALTGLVGGLMMGNWNEAYGDAMNSMYAFCGKCNNPDLLDLWVGRFNEYVKIAPSVKSFCTGVVQTIDGVQFLRIQESWLNGDMEKFSDDDWYGRCLTFKQTLNETRSASLTAYPLSSPPLTNLTAVVCQHIDEQYAVLCSAKRLATLPPEVWRRIFWMAADTWDVFDIIGEPMLLRGTFKAATVPTSA